LNKQISFGIKAEVIEAGKKNTEENLIHVSAMHSYLFTLRYYLSNSPRYYLELGYGIYNLKSMVFIPEVNSSDFEFKQKRGFAPKLGIDFGPVTMNIAYNIIYEPTFPSSRIDYLSVGLGGFFKVKKRRGKRQGKKWRPK
jgi:hypothetical protein